ncbi:GTPase Era [Arthrobacter sp. SO5]|uniref:GTPase family protein n=1 Tax=Arthrobacter sp. SO5 TaxID=1897055 RepID=UPI001E5076FC|nr:GTPase [Arthrobacter sp. SO5]MCB5275937.1 GTPase Era [Arthrobacter sp. SO5]
MTNNGWSNDEFRQKWQEQADKMGRFNLAIFGKTGVGKSTLINAIFGEDVAPTGIGEPVTMENHLYLHRAGFLGLLDTRGLEIGRDTDTLIAELGTYVRRMRANPLSEQIHVAWYCVRATDRRFEDTEAEFIRRLHELGLPVVAVLTQVPSRDGEHHGDALTLADHIAELGLPIVGGRPILVMATGDDFTRQVEHGLKDLLDATFRVAPEGVEFALAAAQKIDLGRKRKQANDTVRLAAALALTVGAIPIPMADAGPLVTIQLGMMARVAAIYGVKVETATLAAAVATTVAVAAGRSAVVSLLKLIPGAGTVVGGTISAAVASTFTMAVGGAWAVVCGELTQGRLKGVDGAVDNEMVRELFQAQFGVWFSKARAAKA